MRVWLADDKPELAADIIQYQESRIQSDPVGPYSDVDVMSITTRQELIERIGDCLKGIELMPDVIFLDLRFDRREDGIDALKFLKYHGEFDIRNIPVIIYSQSDNESDVYVTISFRANAYMTKEGGLRDFWEAVSHWRSTQLAPHTPPNDLTDDLDEPPRSRRVKRKKRQN